eukprot:9229198-Alexandrium_andersonii.AAC.1
MPAVGGASGGGSGGPDAKASTLGPGVAFSGKGTGRPRGKKTTMPTHRGRVVRVYDVGHAM